MQAVRGHGSREIFRRVDYRPVPDQAQKSISIDGSRSVHAVTEFIGTLV